jgi:DeoR/GlpR family transcriptional regulator of sugar metabolism
MWSQDRHRRIQGLLSHHKQVSADELARQLDVSRETIRRDLVELEAAGLLRRVHGGAILPEPTGKEAPFADRMQVRRREKQAIARAAARLVEPGQTCFVDAGSTTALLAVELAKIPGITVITNSIDVAATINREGIEATAVLLGGQLHSDVPGTYGELTLSEIARFQVDIALLSPVAIHAERGASNFILHEAEVARAMIRYADETAMLADHGKIGNVSRVGICACNSIHRLITDSAAERKALSGLRRAGIAEIIVAD